MKRIFQYTAGLIICIFFNVGMWAQVSGYSFSASSGTYSAITGGTKIVDGTTTLDSWVSGAITIPAFTFNSVSYTTAYVTSNGLLTLGGSAPSTTSYTGISSTTGSGIAICPFNADLDRVNSTTSTEIRWRSVGSEVIFQWTQFKRYGVTESFDFQVRLNTSTGTVVFVYQLNSGPGSSTSYQPEVGIRTSTTDYKNLTVTDVSGVPTWASPNLGATNSAKCRFTSTSNAKNFTSGQTYTFTPPTCFIPTALTSSAITATTATISWTAASPAPSGGYQYEVRTSGAAGSGATGLTTSGSTAAGVVSANITGLSASTTYYVYVRSFCGGSDYSVWTASHSFTTTCGAITTYTHTEPFSTYLPSICWSEGDVGDLTAGPTTISATASSWTEDGFLNSGSTGAAKINIDATGDNDWIISPQFTLPASPGHRLKYSVGATQWNGTGAPTTSWESDDFVQVLISTSGYTNWTVLKTYNNTNVPTHLGQIDLIDLSAYAGQTFRIAYRGVEGASDGSADIDFFIDNFIIEAIPTCDVPTSLSSSSITYTTATISWTAPGTGSPSGYQWEVRTSGAAGSGATGLAASGTTAHPTVSANVTGLSGGTTYTYYIRTDCGAGGYSLWVSNTFNTLSCNVPTAVGSSAVTSTTATISWTGPASGSPAGYEYEVRSSGGAGSGATGLAASGSTTSPTVSANITGLTPATTYSIYVRTVCYAGFFSSWTSASTFATACATITPPYTQDFATYLPNCWSETAGALSAPTTTSGTSSNWGADGFANVGTTGATALNIYGTTCDEWLISPSIDLGDGSTVYQLEFDLALTDYGSTSAPDLTGVDDKFAVVISTDAGATWTSANTLMLWDNAGSANVYNSISTSGEKIIINLGAYTGVVKFGFYGESTVSNADNDLSVDNFIVDVVPACPQPTGLTATNILPDEVDLGWTENGSATIWDIELGADGFTPTGTPTANDITTNPYNYSGLSASTAYDFYVRANCGGGDGDSEWTGPYGFTTAAPYMTYVSSTTTQTVTTDVSPSSSNQQVIGIQVVTTGTTSPISITSFLLNTDGTSAPGTDVLRAKLWYTGTSSTFATTTQYGTTYNGPNGIFAINGTQTLSSGTNYFWLTYDLPAGATINNFIDAECNQITVATVDQVPTEQDPVGTRQIKDIYLISDPSTVNVCSGTFHDSGGAAGDYLSSETYTKTFVAATPGSALRFTFTAFNTEASYDYLYVYDGPTTASPQISGSPFNGTTIPATFNSSGQYLTFKFTSDGSGVRAGWAATISCIPITVPVCVTYNAPANTEIDVCPGTVSLKWTGATTGFIADGYKLYFGTDNPPTNEINGIDVGTSTSYDVTNLDANTTYYWRIAPYNTAGTQNGCAVQSFTTLNLGITSTTGLTSCQNTGNISATGGGTITWYNVPTGGSPIGTGSPFAVTFSGNTTYYVAAESSGGGTESGGRLTAASASGFLTTPDWGILFDVTEDLELVSTTIYPSGTGTVTIALLNDAGTEIASTGAINVTGSGLSTPVVVPLGFNISPGTNYKLVLKSYTGITDLIRDSSPNSFPYSSPSGAISVTAGWWGSSATAYYWFYNLQVTSGCVSARVPVNVVHTADPITITPDGPTTFLDGGSVGLTASSAAAPAYTYTWSPATGLNTTSGAVVIASPNTTTTYTVTGTNGTCTHTEEITVTVTYPCTGLGTGYTVVSSLPFNQTSTTCGAVNDITSANALVCSSSSYYTGEDVVYSFTPLSDGLVTIDLSSTGTNTGIMLYDGCPMAGQGGNCITQAQSSTGNKSLCINLQQDVTYYLVVDSYSSPSCNPFTIDISAPDPAGVANDLPCNATPIAMGGLQAGNNSCTTGTDEPSAASCWTTGTLNTVWYSFVAPASGSVKIRTTLGTLTATQIAVYQGTCDNLTVVSNSCNVDASGVCSGTTNNSAIELSGLASGNTYYIRIDGENDLTGDFDIEVIDGTLNWPYVPQQDCGSATLVCNAQTVVGDPGFLGAGSTCDYSTPYGCFSFGTQNNTVWYKIDIANTGTMIFEIVPNLSSTDYDWALINVTGNASACAEIAANTLAPVRCNFSGTSGTTGLAVGDPDTSVGAGGDPFCSPLSVTAGDSYQLLIWNWSGNNTGFTLDLTNSGAGIVNYAQPTSLTWSGGASTDWFNPVNWGGCDIPDCDIDVIIVNGPTNQPVINADGAVCKSISIESGASLTVNANRTLTVCNDFNNIGTLNMDPTSTILLNNNGADHELNGSLTGSNALGNLTVNKTSGSVKFMQDIEIQGDLTTANATSIIDVNGKNVTIGGDFIPWDATYSNLGTGTLTFNGSTLQSYNPGGDITLHNVTMNNSGSGLILSRNLILGSSAVLTLNNGIINTNSNMVVVNNADPSAVSDGTSSSYIFGQLRRYFASNAGVYSFPHGTATAYRLAKIINNNLVGVAYFDSWFSSSFTAGTISASDLGTPYTSVAGEGIWTITPDAQPSGGTYSILLYFDDGGSSEVFSLTDNMFGPLKRLNSSQPWVTGGGSLNTVSTPGRTVAGGYARRSGLSDFSEFAIGKSNVILPVTLLYVNAKCDDDNVVVNWATAQETNNAFFTIYRSFDARYFEPIGKIDGAGNSSTPLHYHFTDNNVSNHDDLYYKIVQTDFDGTESSSQIVGANCGMNMENKPFTVFNTVESQSLDIMFFIDADSDTQISVVDNLGRVLFSDNINTFADQYYSIDKNGFAPGSYSLVVSIESNSYTEKFIVIK